MSLIPKSIFDKHFVTTVDDICLEYSEEYGRYLEAELKRRSTGEAVTIRLQRYVQAGVVCIDAFVPAPTTHNALFQEFQRRLQDIY